MSKFKNKAPLGASLVVLSSIFYASYGIWTTLMGDFFGGYTASALRSILVLLILLPIALILKKIEKINWEKNKKYLLVMVFGSVFVWGPLYYAVLEAGVGVSLTITYTAIVIGMFFFGWLLAGEKFTKDKQLSALLGFIGLAFIFSPNVEDLGLLALTAALISGLGIAATSVTAKQLSYNATYSTIMLWVTSVIANIPMSFLFREKFPKIGLDAEWFYLIIFAIASTASSWLLIRGLKLIDAGAAGVLGLLEIAFAIVFGITFFDEPIRLSLIIGAIIIVTASSIPYYKEYKANLVN